MTRFQKPIETREQMERCLRNDCSAAGCDTYTDAESRARFLAMYDAYRRGAQRHISVHYGSWKGWGGNFMAMVRAGLATPGAALHGMLDSRVGGVANNVSATITAEMQRGCELTSVAMQRALDGSNRPPGWHTMIARVGTLPGHVAAATCHAPAKWDDTELWSPLTQNGFVFDPWLRGKPDVWTFTKWLSSVKLIYNIYAVTQQVRVESKTAPLAS